MKSFILTLTFFVFSSAPLFAQEATRVRVEDGQDTQKALKDQVYRYPNFQTGKVVLQNGNSNTAKLNLNLLTDQMQFIDEEQDTLTILALDLVHYIEIGETKFLYRNGYLELIGEYDPLVLAVNRKMKVADQQRVGAYGTKSSSASIANINTGFTDKLRYNPTVYEDLLMNTKAVFYLLDKESNIILVNKRNVLNAFSDHSGEIKEYFRQHKVNFKSEKDVRALLQYAIEL